MSKNIRTGNSTRVIQKLQSQLTLGRFQLENYRKEHNSYVDMKTYYLLKDGKIITYREWYQMERPEYLLSGSKHGCLSYWKNRP